MNPLKRLARWLPARQQRRVRRWQYARQIRRGTFVSDEPEFSRLHEWVRPRMMVLDIGANIGHYSLRMAELVGPQGRVLSFEPILDTFEILVSNLAAKATVQISPWNTGVSDVFKTVKMSVPRFDNGLPNYYEARIQSNTTENAGVPVICIAIDSLGLLPVGFAKIDVEGHELSVINGMRNLIARDRPTLLIEGRNPEIAEILASAGYRHCDIDGSPNRLFTVR